MVQVTAEKTAQLFNVDTRLRFEQTVEQESLLQRRERIDVFGSRMYSPHRLKQDWIGRIPRS